MSGKHYPVVLEQDADGVFIVACPTFKGCRSYGHTIDEAMANIREAIAVCRPDHGFQTVPKGLLHKIIRNDLELDVNEFFDA